MILSSFPFLIDAGYLPLIGLPKKRVDFDPRKSIIQPLAVHDVDASWRNLNAEITRRKSSSSCLREKVNDDVRSNSPSNAAATQPGTMARIQRRFKKALVRLRQVFMSDAGGGGDEANDHKDSTRRPSRTLVRRDSNVNSAKRLAAKRRRMNLSELEALVEAECNNRLDEVNENGERDAGQITSELVEIFEKLSVSVRKRPRLTTMKSFDFPDDQDALEPS